MESACPLRVQIQKYQANSGKKVEYRRQRRNSRIGSEHLWHLGDGQQLCRGMGMPRMIRRTGIRMRMDDDLPVDDVRMLEKGYPAQIPQE